MNTKGINTERGDWASSLPSAQRASSSSNQASEQRGSSSNWCNQSQPSPPSTGGFAGVQPRIQPSNHTTALTVNIPVPSSSEPSAAARTMQRIGVQCPDIALLDSEIAGEICGDRRLQNASSWQSDYDADDYDKENQCVYRENIDNADGIYGIAHTETELVLYPSPAFSEDSMYPTSSSYPGSAVPGY